MILEPQELKAALKPAERLFGLDLGTKTIGIAVSDPMHSVASPVTTIRRTKLTKDVEELAKLMAERRIGGMVLGLPRNMDGSEGPRCQATRQFAKNLEARADMLGSEPRIAFWDERLSTVAVQRLMTDEADLSRAKRSKSVDQMAAAYILQGFLDAFR